ncbi:Coenzyme F420 hydrogenase/dehydrogenase, beta subunit C-terminal domain [Parabacteroides sp.]
MIDLCNSSTCTSCSACKAACNVDAIAMVEDGLSVRVPHVDKEKCRSCGACMKACPIIFAPVLSEPIEAIALYTKNVEDCNTCSSGGAATALSRYVLRRGGVVFGATLYGMPARFIAVELEEQLDMLKGSKYVFVSSDGIYPQVLLHLRAGRECLFIGLPCNVAGLKTYIGKDYPNLTTVDLVCHGAPPTEYLMKHLMNKIDIQHVSCIEFRGRRDFYLTALDNDGVVLYSVNQQEDEYFTAFMRGYSYRPACYSCRFAGKNRISDITVGDYWGIGDDALSEYKGKISLALLNSAHGVELFNSIKKDVIWEKRTVEEAVAGNKQLRQPTHYSLQSKLFREEYLMSGDFAKAIKAAGVNKIVWKNKLRRYILAFPRFIRDTICK